MGLKAPKTLERRECSQEQVVVLASRFKDEDCVLDVMLVHASAELRVDSCM